MPRSGPGSACTFRRMRWTLIHSADADGVTNMARDEAMLALVRERVPSNGTSDATTSPDPAGTGNSGILRIYGWSSPVLSLGRHQKALGVGVVRRPTGGRAVLHHREITYAAAAPIRLGETLRDAAATVDAMLLSALARLGVKAAVANPSSRAPAPDAAPCFALPVRGELLADERKLVGSAQWREEDAWLQHGSILVDDDQGMIAQLANDPSGQSSGQLATLRSLLDRTVSTGEFMNALREVLLEGDSLSMENENPTSAVEAKIDEVAEGLKGRYASYEWTWRR
jgi:lipoate-protein ligase A